ncbi:murein L,D-transpeptidase catalytic domain-containing protein [Novosphingobium sp.]|uniref:murein L,D-transpeptidase catalytic domain-containing protein n=1 Tax=Novosphingobium sp. TaxID=1874826 RepID=UPI0025F402C0|nr:murein L,D-transpeptidase catalytic domain family protein [Novosphingobium sp.]
MKRRDLILGGLAAGAALAVPGRALARQVLGDEFDKTFGLTPAPVEPAVPAPPPLPTEVVPNPAYDRKILEIAARERDRAGAALWRRDIVGVADFARPSTLPRLHFANLENGTVRSFLVAHGRGSDPEHSGFLQQFSNVPGSEATSRGAYITAEWYKGKYGTSIRLLGQDSDNSTALQRAIVMHPASYATESHIARFGRLGRSEGCFAMSPDQFNEALWHLSGGRLLYADRIGDA